MESLFHPPFNLLVIGLGFWLLLRALPQAKGALLTVRQDGMLPLLVCFIFTAVVVAALVKGP
jgi:hypothetical protein